MTIPGATQVRGEAARLEEEVPVRERGRWLRAASFRSSEWRRRTFAFGVMVLSVLCVFAALMALRRAGLMRPLDFLAYDHLVRHRNAHANFMWDSPVVVVRLTEEDIQKLMSYPLSDLKMAETLEKILACGPAAVGVDIFRDLPVRGYEEPEDGPARLAKVLEENPHVVFITSVVQDRGVYVRAPAAIRGEGYESQRGFYNHVGDRDHVIRRTLLSQQVAGEPFVAFPFWLALNYLDLQGIRPAPRASDQEPLRLGKATFRQFRRNDGDYVRAEDKGEQFLLDYRGPRQFRWVTVSDVLAGAVGPEVFEGKLVLLGVVTPTIKDFNPTPLDEATPGVEIHAHTADQLIRGALLGHEPTRVLSDVQEALWILLWTVLGATLGLFVRRPLNFGLVAVGGLVVLYLLVRWLFLRDLWVPSVEPALAWFVTASIVGPSVSQHERAQRAVMMEIMQRTHSKAVANELWEQRDAIIEGGKPKSQLVVATVLFTDLAGFSTVSEKMEPAKLMEWLSEYITRMSEIVEANHGHVYKFIGDAVMAVYGAPVPSLTDEARRGDAANAVRTALDMRADLARLNAEWTRRGLPAVRMRVGIMTGELVAGGLGLDRFEYTVIGDTVNTAARLESYDKTLMPDDVAANGCRILIGEPTHERVKELFQTRRIGAAELHNKAQTVDVFGVVG